MFFDSPCNHCPAKCCKNYSVSLTHSDLFRLKELLGSNFSQYLEFDLALGHDENLAPHFLLNLDGSEKFYILRLKRDKKETCLFLGKNNLCTIYDSRPRKCRTYPFIKDNLSISLKEGSRCPVSWNLDSTLIDQFISDLTNQKDEISQFSKLCKKWNAQNKIQKTKENFLNYLFENASL